jgi:two-component system OmpR family response regulator
VRILVVDDNQSITKMLHRYFTTHGIDVTTLNDGISALRSIQKQKFDVILLDMAMPGFNGADIINGLEKINILEQQKIIILSASSVPDGAIRSLLSKKGVHTFLEKPVDLKDLLHIVSQSRGMR